MSYNTFSISLKSTIDYLAKQVADSKGLPFLDLAAAAFDPSVFESDQPAICWDLASIHEHPRDPMYTATFDIGAMTMLDPSQYISLDIVGDIANLFQVGVTLDIYDYSGAFTSVQKLGRMRVIQCGLSPSQQDAQTNVRFVTVTVMAVRFV
jgi:hypothetical protein